MKNSYFLDSSYAIALAIRDDEHHESALKLADEIKNSGIRLFTTRPVLLEIGNSLSRKSKRTHGIRMLAELANDTNISVVELDLELYERALDLFSTRADKEWGLVDCVSFVVMKEQNIEAALTSDKHFIQAGFRSLLREEPAT